MYQIADGAVVLDAPKRRISIGLPGFLALIFCISWIGAAPMVLASWGGENARLLALARTLAPLQILMFFGPMIATVLVTFVNYGSSGLKDLFGALFRFRIRGIWYFLALTGPLVVTLSASVLAREADTSLPLFVITSSMMAVTGQTFLMYLFLNTEEIAWRGYALPYLQGRMSPLRANLTLGVIWGVFHSPLFFMQGGHPAGYSILVFFVMVLSITLIAGFIFNATRGSILISHLLHQSFNAWGEGLRIFPVMNDGSPWPFRLTVLILIALGLCCGVLLAMRRPRAAGG